MFTWVCLLAHWNPPCGSNAARGKQTQKHAQPLRVVFLYTHTNTYVNKTANTYVNTNANIDAYTNTDVNANANCVYSGLPKKCEKKKADTFS